MNTTQGQFAPAAPPAATQPPVAAGGGSVSPEYPERGGLKIKVIASIQAIYAREEQKKQGQLQQQQSPLQLQPGWGGQGR